MEMRLCLLERVRRAKKTLGLAQMTRPLKNQKVMSHKLQASSLNFTVLSLRNWPDAYSFEWCVCVFYPAPSLRWEPSISKQKIEETSLTQH